MDWMLMPYRRYFDFSGRSRRMEFWMFQLLIFIVYVVVMIVATVLGGGMEAGNVGPGGAAAGIVFIAFGIWGIATIIPSLALAVRRLHDTDRSGWWILIGFVPIVGALVLLYFYLIEGTRGPNSFGQDPKEGVQRGV